MEKTTIAPQIVILAGGLGTRLRPVTYQVPKVMISVAGKPFLEHQLRYFEKFGFRKFLLLVGYLAQQIESYFRAGQDLGIEMDYVHEGELMGTAGALKSACSKLEEKFILVNGDTFCPLDYRHFLTAACQVRKGILMTVYDNHDRLTTDNVKVEADLRVSSYSREGRQGMKGIHAGVVFFNKDVLQSIPKNRKLSLEEEIYPIFVQKKLVKAYVTDTRYYDMGTFERLDLVRKIFQQGV